MFDFDLVLSQLGNLDFTPFLVAILVGGSIGLEREIHGRPAGLRTHILVCLSSTVLIHISQSLPESATGELARNLVYDPNRIAAGIVTGIGFLGAAAVIRSGDIVRGITTGACVWSVAVLGIAIGQHRYGTAVAAGAIMLTVLVVMDRVFSWIKPVVYRRLTVRGRTSSLSDTTASLIEQLREEGVGVQDVSCEVPDADDSYVIQFYIRCRNHRQAALVVERVSRADSVSGVAWSTIQAWT